jgi:MFS family permease
MRSDELRPAPVTRHERGAVRAAIGYVGRTPALAIPLGMMALVGTLAFNFQTVLPLLAHFTFDGGADAYAVLLGAMGVGSIAGALANGARGRTGPRLLVASALGFGAFGLLAAAAPSFPLEVAALVPLGAASITFAAGVNSQLQLEVEPAMRGRVMALYSIVFLGSTPLGGPLTGWLSEALGPRAGLVLGGLAALTAGIGAWVAFSRAHGSGSATRPRRAGGGRPREGGFFGDTAFARVRRREVDPS